MTHTLAECFVNDSDVTLLEAALIGPGDPEIVACEAELRAAQLAADVPSLDLLISDELLFTGPDGQLATKAQDLHLHATGTVRFHRHEPEELRIRRVSPSVAITTLLTRLEVSVAGQLFEGLYRYTRVWAREGGPWCVVGGHVSAATGEI